MRSIVIVVIMFWGFLNKSYAEILPAAIARIGKVRATLSPEELLEAAVAVTGADGLDRSRALARGRKLIARAQTEIAPGDTWQRAEALLGLLHRDTLKSYVANQARLDVLLQRGTFNCLSSTVAYMIMARAQGIVTRAILCEPFEAAASGHALCIVQQGGRTEQVETTSRYGFSPGTQKPLLDDLARVVGVVVTPQQLYRRKREVSDAELLMELAVPLLNAAGERRDPFGLTRAYAIRWTIAGRREDRDALLQNGRVVLHEHLSKKRFAQAQAWHAEVCGVLGGGEPLEPWQQEITLHEAVTAGDSRKALTILRSARGPWQPELRSMVDTIEYNAGVAFHNDSVRALQEGRIDDARRIVAQGLKELPQSKMLREDWVRLEVDRAARPTASGGNPR